MVPGVLAVDWNAISVAGAFIVGAVLATFATLRLLRIAAGYLRSIEPKEKKDDR